MLRNKCYHELLPFKLDIVIPHSPPLKLTHFPDYVGNPDEPMSVPYSISIQFYLRRFRYWCDYILSSTYAIIILQFYRFFNMRCSLLFFSWERRWGSNPRPHCSQSHVLPSTPLWGSRLKLLRNKCDHEFLPSILDYPHHNNITARQHTDACLLYTSPSPRD